MKFKYFTIVIFSIISLIFLAPALAALDNKGSDFIVAFNPNLDSGGNRQLQLTADVATNVTVNYPVLAPTFTATVAVTPGVITTVDLPIQVSEDWAPGNGIVQDNAVRAFSTTGDEFVMYLINRRPTSSDAALALPVDAFNKSYIVMDYNPAFVGAQFTVVAGFDGTDVTITPATAINGWPAGVPFTITLDRGEGAFFQSATTSSSNTLTGTLVESTRPIGMVNGNGCTQIPNGTTYCDHIFEMAQPVQSWGRSIPVGNLPNRSNGSIYRILASEDNTNVTQDGVALVTLNRGQFHETLILPGDHVFAADKPIYVTQFMPGDGSPGAIDGDPAMGNMIPSDQYPMNYTFATVGDAQFATHFLTIIANNSDLSTILLDGAVIGAASFDPIAGTDFSVARLPLIEGTHTTSSSIHGHGITVEGFNRTDSYIYPGGALFAFINPTGDPFDPVCTASVSGAPPKVNGSCTDNMPSEDVNNNGVLDVGEDNNGNGVIDADTGIFFVTLEAGATNLVLTVDPFVLGDSQVTFMVDLIDPSQPGTGMVHVTDGVGNAADVPVNLGLSQSIACDVDENGDIDRTDIGLIFAARGMTASGPNDPRDPNGDGIITVQDARICTLRISAP